MEGLLWYQRGNGVRDGLCADASAPDSRVLTRALLQVEPRERTLRVVEAPRGLSLDGCEDAVRALKRATSAPILARVAGWQRVRLLSFFKLGDASSQPTTPSSAPLQTPRTASFIARLASTVGVGGFADEPASSAGTAAASAPPPQWCFVVRVRTAGSEEDAESTHTFLSESESEWKRWVDHFALLSKGAAGTQPPQARPLKRATPLGSRDVNVPTGASAAAAAAAVKAAASAEAAAIVKREKLAEQEARERRLLEATASRAMSECAKVFSLVTAKTLLRRKVGAAAGTADAAAAATAADLQDRLLPVTPPRGAGLAAAAAHTPASPGSKVTLPKRKQQYVAVDAAPLRVTSEMPATGKSAASVRQKPVVLTHLQPGAIFTATAAGTAGEGGQPYLKLTVTVEALLVGPSEHLGGPVGAGTGKETRRVGTGGARVSVLHESGGAATTSEQGSRQLRLESGMPVKVLEVFDVPDEQTATPAECARILVATTGYVAQTPDALEEVNITGGPDDADSYHVVCAAEGAPWFAAASPQALTPARMKRPDGVLPVGELVVVTRMFRKHAASPGGAAESIARIVRPVRGFVPMKCVERPSAVRQSFLEQKLAETTRKQSSLEASVSSLKQRLADTMEKASAASPLRRRVAEQETEAEELRRKYEDAVEDARSGGAAAAAATDERLSAERDAEVEALQAKLQAAQRAAQTQERQAEAQAEQIAMLHKAVGEAAARAASAQRELEETRTFAEQRTTEVVALHADVGGASGRVEAAEAEAATLAAQLAAERRRHEAAAEQLAARDASVAALQREVRAAEAARAEAAAQRDAQVRGAALLREAAEEAEARAEELRAAQAREAALHAARLAAADERHIEAEQQALAAATRVGGLEEEAAVRAEEAEDLLEQLVDAQAATDELTARAERLSADLDAAQASHAAEADALHGNIAGLKQEGAALARRLAAAEERVAALREEGEARATEADALLDRLAAADASLAQLRRKEGDLVAQLAAAEALACERAAEAGDAEADADELRVRLCDAGVEAAAAAAAHAELQTRHAAEAAARAALQE
eukprot:Rhum_TRINITY_DN14264_c11_g1::Rhum_TRINITY_DN14264_c11_g1_i1::g.76506::m.76506